MSNEIDYTDTIVTDEDRARAEAMKPLVVGPGPWYDVAKELNKFFGAGASTFTLVKLKHHVDTEIAALRAKLAEAEAKLAVAMRVVEAAAWGNRIRNDRERAHGARPRKSESYFAALDNDELAATEAIDAALAAMTPDATITREDA